MRTIFPWKNDDSSVSDTNLTQNNLENGDADMAKWPKRVKHRNKVLAKVYRPCRGRNSYRVTWYASGKRQMKYFPTYAGKGGAKEFSEALVKELANNSQAVMLTSAQASDALAAIERLATFYQTTGRKVSLLASVSEYCEAAARVPGRTLTEVAEGFSRTVATVKRQDLKVAIEEFIAVEEPRTQNNNGQRAQLSPKYHYNRAIQLRRFSGTFPGYAVCDIGKHDLDSFFASKLIAEFSPKSRNHHRAALAQFFSWCVRKDYLSVGHRLNEADALRPEHANTAEVEFYTPKEFRALLETADGPMRAMMAIGGLAGLRTAELLRLDWADVWRVRGHVEVTAGKSKTRQRRLVEIRPALAAWLAEFRTFKTGKLCTLHEITFQQHFVELCKEAGVTRKVNGLRHAFCTYHFASHGNENLTAQQAGNSPTMIHAHYKGLATKKEAETWFAVKPPKTLHNVIPMTKKKAVL
jgi:integrase